MLEIHSLTVGPLQSNCHVVADTETNQCAVVDPGDEAHTILQLIQEKKLRCEAIWLTHAHIDHIGALADVALATHAPIWIHPAEKEWLVNPDLNLATWAGLHYEPCEATYLWKDGDEVDGLGRRWRILHVPGHSPGLCAIVSNEEKICFAGDLIFQGSMGRVDLPGGDSTAMADSLIRFYKEPDDLTLYVGHGPETHLGREKEANWVVKEFLDVS